MLDKLWSTRTIPLDAKNYFDLSANPIPPFVRNQFGVVLTGGAFISRDQFARSIAIVWSV
jgi:hypothetical protein